MNAFVIAFLLLCLGNEAFSLECNTCKNCGSSYGSPVECPVITSYIAECYKEIEADGTINRGCSDSVVCLAKEADPAVGKCVDQDKKPCYICCNDVNNCNGAPMTTVSVMTTCSICCDDVDNCNGASMATVSVMMVIAAFCIFLGVFSF